MDFVSQLIFEPVVKALTGYITQKLSNFTSSADRVKEMIEKMEVLEGQRVDNKKHLKRNRENKKEIPDRVRGWLKEAKKIKEDVENDGCFDLENKMRRNSENNREIPDRVPESLEEVEKIKEDADNIPTNNVGSFNIKKKYLAGRNALRYIKDIDRLIKESSEMKWSDADIGFGRVDSKRLASTSGGGTQNLFKSRVKMFNDALTLLKENDDDAARVIALCGMGGVGKTTLMNDLKKVATEKKMFNWISVAVIGNNPDWFKIQKVIAADTGEPLTETDETLMATSLSKRFEEFSERKERCLVILDDVWERINLKDIGLASPLPKGVKLLLTSRNANICHQIAVDAGSVLQAIRVDVLEEEEARDFFCQITKISAEHDRDLYEKGCKIVKKCGYLPIAIELIAATLNSKDEFLWRHALKRLKKNNLDENVQKIISISYESLVHDDKVIFLLCGLFPEDSNISIESLTRYAWGLELLKEDSSMEDARDSTQTSVSNLKNAYLLMNGDSRYSDCVKMHDLVLAFAVATLSKGGQDGCRIIHHEDDFSKLSEENNMSQSCKQLSLTCKGMSKFPSEFQFPNLSLLKLMHGNESLKFPLDFYEGMKKLQVIAFDILEYPVVPTSFRCSTNLRTLCLNGCSLMFDLTCIGNLSNLEVLSFAFSSITILPSTFGNLKKLRLLDVTGCYNLVIDDGVLKSLVKLEELYMIPYYGKACCITENNSSELAERSKNLRALEFEFIGNNAHMNISYEKLKRFKLSVGCSFKEVRFVLRTRQVDYHSYENSLNLITNREELLKSEINELFKITDALYLQVNDMNTLEDVDVESPHHLNPPRNSSFYNLRFLVVTQCADLRYLFTMNVATSLSKLEYLDIFGCPIMEAVIHTENDGSDTIKFSNLKYLRLAKLPKLLHFCKNIDVIELPRLMELILEGLPKFTIIYPGSATSFLSSNISPTQSFLNAHDATPKMEKLFVSNMENLRELTVEGCGSIEVLFNMDFGEIEHLISNLRSIKVKRCDSLVKLFSCNPFPFLNNLQELNVESCGSIQVLFNTDLGRANKSEEQVCSSSLRSLKVSKCDSLVNLLPINPMPLFNHLEELRVTDCASVEVIFDIDMGCGGEMDKVSSSGLRSVEVTRCDSHVNLFSCNPFPCFNNLQEVEVRTCGSSEVIFDNDMGCVGEMDKVSSSKLRSIYLVGLGKLREVWRIKDAGNNKLIHGFEAVESIRIILCERFEKLITPATTKLDMRALKEVEINRCGRESERKNELVEKEKECGRESGRNNELAESEESAEINAMSVLREDSNDEISEIAFPSYLLPTFHNLHELELEAYKGVEVVFEITTASSRESPHNTQQPPILPYLEELKLWYMGRMSHVWKCDWNEFFIILQKPQSQSSFHNLTTITMFMCNSIKYLFSPLMAKLLSNLKKIDISFCAGIEEVVSNRDDEDASIYSHTTTTFFPHLDLLQLEELRNLKCIGGGANGISTDIHDQLKLSQASWSICQYAREISIRDCDALSSVIRWYAVGQMQKLQVLKIEDCESMTEVFETQEINNKSGTDTGKSLPRLEYITMLKLPKLKILKIQGCNLLEHIFTFSTLESLTQLEELEVKDCKAMEVIVAKENGEQTTVSDVVVFDHLKSLILINLPNFVGFFLGKNEFRWPALEKVVIGECPQITVFTYGQSTAPKLNFINTSLGKHSVECGLNFHVTTTSHQARLPSYESTSSYRPTNMERLPWSYHNLIEADMYNYNPSGGQSLFSSDEVSQLQKLETVRFVECEDIEEIFDSETDAEIPNLRQVDLEYLYIKYIWKSKQGTVLKFPNLTRLTIHWCHSLEYVFTCPMVGSLLQLQELHISECRSMKVIVKGEEECDGIVNASVVFPCLKSLILESLYRLEGFCIGKEAFEFPSLDTLQIDDCSKMRVFTKGDLSAPKLYAIRILGAEGYRKYNIHNRLNSYLDTLNKRRD